MKCRPCRAVFAVLTLFVQFSLASAHSQIREISTIPPHTALVFDSGRGRLYYSDPVRQALVAVKLDTGAELYSLPLGMQPSGMTLSPDSQRLYVGMVQTNAEGYATEQPGKIAVIDPGDEKMLQELNYGYSPRRPPVV